jgi:hypothetical protein
MPKVIISVSAVDPSKTKIKVRKMTAAERKSSAKSLNTEIIVIVDRQATGVSGANYEALRLSRQEAHEVLSQLLKLMDSM